MPTLGTVHENIQAQGFCGLDDKTSAQINYPLRLSPAICMVWAAAGTALASPTILWAWRPLQQWVPFCPGIRLMFSTTMACVIYSVHPHCPVTAPGDASPARWRRS